MTNVLVLIIWTLVTLGVICLISVFSDKLNMAREVRYKQFPMPIIGVVYSIFAIILVDQIYTLFISAMLTLADWLYGLAGASWMPFALSDGVYNMGMSVESVTEADSVAKQFLLMNISIVVLYVLLKAFAMRIITRLTAKDDGSLDRIYEINYDYFTEDAKWFLAEKNAQARDLLRVLNLFTIIIVGLVVAIMVYAYTIGLMTAMFYPIMCVIMIGEVFYYFDGISKAEKTIDIYGEFDSVDSVNYSLIRKALKALFGDKLLADNTSSNDAEGNSSILDRLVESMENSDNPKVVNLAEYIHTASSDGYRFDPNYVTPMRELVEGKSILFNNPFYRDLIPYAFYPMNRTLLSHKKALVILGRHATEKDAIKWIHEGIGAVTNIPFMWRVGVLDETSQNIDIGIITRSDVHNIEMHEKNAQFLEEVEYVIILEPSKLISTAQIGLNLLAKKMRTEEDKIVTYCLCDKNCDGLVDAMSHVLMTNITEVSATQKHKGLSSYMCWEADEEYLHHRITPSISKYLGIGTELSFVAFRNRIKKAKWYGGEAFPVTDISWISKQYYYDLMNYAGLPANQDTMSDYFVTSPNMWAASIEKNNYIIVEDEAFNMFEVLRDFSTRAERQGFINIISSDYLMKEYMADNDDVFIIDPKAVPCIVADYARTDRNVTLRLLLMMSMIPINEESVRKELSLMGVETFDLKRQLWFEVFKCFANVKTIASLPNDYRDAVNKVADMEIEVDGNVFSSAVLEHKKTRNPNTNLIEKTFSVTDENFIKACVGDLRSASYIAEDENGEKYYLGTELYDHVYSKYLPGQYFTFGGKYYEMLYLTADGKALVRRAADHIIGRPSYRQIRNYHIENIKTVTAIGAKKNYDGIVVSKANADFEVHTHGYFRMDRHNDFETAKKVLIEGEGIEIPTKKYRNKEMLVIELPDMDGKLTDDGRYTLTVLINELFRTMFAENQHYISAVTDSHFLGENYDDKPLTYSLEGVNSEDAKKCIYIFEDSRLDMGLISAVERNIRRILYTIHDYLEWHFEKMEQEKNPPQPVSHDVPFVDNTDDRTYVEKEPKKQKFFLLRWLEWLFNKLKIKKKKENETKHNGEQNVTTGVDGDGDAKEKTDNRDSTTVVHALESEPSAEVNIVFENPGAVKHKSITDRQLYSNRHYMLFGKSEMCEVINLKGVHDYLTAHGFSNNPLQKARYGKAIADQIAESYDPSKAGVRFCDFCGREIFADDYETLTDGRDRCRICAQTAITSLSELQRLFEDVKRNMEAFYSINLNTSLSLEMVNAKKLHKALGRSFVPTAGYDGRVLGVAINKRGQYKLLLENGSPRLGSLQTMVHELTHIWQYENWNTNAIKAKYGPLELEIYEGMAQWVEIQYCHLIGETAAGIREEKTTIARNDEYGIGYLRYQAQYPINRDTVIDGQTPFDDKETPLADEYCRVIRS